MKPLSILTVDDQALFREGLTLVLNKLYPNTKVKQASSGPEAFDLGLVRNDRRHRQNAAKTPMIPETPASPD